MCLYRYYLYYLPIYIHKYIDTYKHLFTKATYIEMCVCVYVCKGKHMYNRIVL